MSDIHYQGAEHPLHRNSRDGQPAVISRPPAKQSAVIDLFLSLNFPAKDALPTRVMCGFERVAVLCIAHIGDEPDSSEFR